MVLPSFAMQLNRTIVSCLLIIIDSVFFIGSYGVLRVLRISVNWVVWILGYLIIVASVAVCYSIFTPTYSLRDVGYGNLLAVFSFGITVYAVSQWVSRRWYVFIKKRTLSFVAQQSRNFFLFARKHHALFGWIVASAAIAHMAVYLPILSEAKEYEIVTGFIAIGILALSVLLGVWIWFVTSVQKKRTPKLVHTTHSILTVVFLLSLAIHI
ncbi:hypothetical protein ccbrp13_02140 [Ktedonobacteria bacterium brp13]|nr:hypothetical protein ccbrp13_02140 [Ktedonobacteria bacterium brp13]